MYLKKGYFYWRNPITGKEKSLGKDLQLAIAKAKAANEWAAKEMAEPEPEKPKRTLGDFLAIYRAAKEPEKIRTLYAWRSNLKKIDTLSDMVIGVKYEDMPAISQRCFEFIDGYTKAGKARTAKVLHSALSDIFAAMMGRGWLAMNPVKDLKVAPAKVKRQRLTLETFMAIYKVAGDVAPWLPHAMELGVVSLQRLDEVANMTFKAVEDERLKVIQKKTGTRLRIPINIRLGAVGWSLGDVVKRCRDNVLSPYLVHHVAHQGRAKPGMRVNPQTISAAFTAARKRAGIVVEPGKTPPTFHELRSLGIRLYKAEGYNPQSLAGHKEESTTAVYADDRGAEWTDVILTSNSLPK